MQNSKTKREVIKMILDGRKPLYVSWSFKFTQEPKEELQRYYGTEDLDVVYNQHYTVYFDFQQKTIR